MKKLTKFTWEIEKERIFRIMKCHLESPMYHNLSDIFDNLLKDINNFIDPLGVYSFIDIPQSFKSYNIINSRKVVLFFLTLGERVSLKINEYFTEGEYLKAMLLEVMADEILFKMTDQLYSNVLLEARQNNWNLSTRYEPGSENVPLHVQKDIFNLLNLGELGISLSSNFMLMPLKSITFFCGAGEGVCETPQMHDCSKCNIKKCMFRDEK
ncbi:MAG: hypothetical protein ACOYJ1_02510 [Peptococcales bacterium]|jgi:hypothetical protein